MRGCWLTPGSRACPRAAARAELHHDVHMPIITIQNLTKDFGAVRAVDDLSFDIDEGKVVGFLGPNGSGKTTTLRSLVGLVSPTSGTATIHGVRYAELVDPLSQIGVMLEAASHPARTARNHLRVLAAEARVPLSRADEMLELVDLGDAARRRSGGFSLGMTPAARPRRRAARRSPDPRPRRARQRPRPRGHPLAARLPARRWPPRAARCCCRATCCPRSPRPSTRSWSSTTAGSITHSPLAALSSGAGPRVRVRSPQLRAPGARCWPSTAIDAAHDGPDSLVVVGSTQEAIGQLAFDHGVVLYEIAPESSNLEDVFFDLTSTPELEVVAS